MLKTIRSFDKPVCNKNNSSKLASNNNKNSKSAFEKNDSNNKVNRFDVSNESMKHIKKLKKSKS